jgi:hypothetical protein
MIFFFLLRLLPSLCHKYYCYIPRNELVNLEEINREMEKVYEKFFKCHMTQSTEKE